MTRIALALTVVLAVTAAPAGAATPRFERIGGYASPGTPPQYNKVGILKAGKAKAKNVLVLNPGTSASAAYFAPLMKSIVAKSPKWQVWAVERRENLLEDHSVFDEGKAGTKTIQEVFQYYIGWLKDPDAGPHVELLVDDQVAYAKRWGMDTQIRDLRRVVLRAEKLGGKVVVGGHSLGGTITSAYATWDFKGRPGAKGLDGLVFIDGGSGPTAISVDDARAKLEELTAHSPWLSFGGIGAPFTGLFNTTGSLSVKLDPDAPSDGQASGLLPENIIPPYPVTNAGLYGYALDTETSPDSLAAAQAHLGTQATTGDPRGWDDADELTPLARYADAFGGTGLESLDGTAWYHPLKLTIDAGAVAAGNANDAQEVLDVHATHGDDLPRKLRIYAFGASLGGTRVIDAAKTLAQQSGIPRKRLTLVDRHTTYAHNDPNTAAPAKNEFLKRLKPFLRAVAG